MFHICIELEKIYQNSHIKPILSTSYLYKENFYIKTSSSNGILFKQQQRSKDFATYSSFIHKLGLNEYIINGEATYDIPFILKLKKFDFERERMIDEQIKADVDTIMQRGSLTYFSNENYQNYKPLETNQFDMENFDEKNINDDNDEKESFMNMTIEEAMNNNAQIEANEKELEPSKEEVFKEPIEQKASNENENIVENTSFIEPVEKEEAPSIVVNDNIHSNDTVNFDVDNNILNDTSINENENENEDDNDNDIIDANMLNLLDVLDVEENLPEEHDEIGLDDNEVADDINNADETNEAVQINENIDAQNQEDTIFENENKNEDIITSEIENNITEQLPYSQNDDIPIVGVDDLEENENTCDTKFKEGDRIHNKKYGNGTIEKILKCNDKYLFSIQFDEHGRKLLNPQLANIEPIN